MNWGSVWLAKSWQTQGDGEFVVEKILIINGSPRKGNTEALASAFAQGAEEAGHKVSQLRLRELYIHPCTGCMLCQQKKGNPCLQTDDMNKVYEEITSADVVVFASPVYWMYFTGLFKVMLDRLYALAPYGIGKKEAVLLMAAATDDDFIFSQVRPYYEKVLVQNLGWTNRGEILAKGVTALGEAEKTRYVQDVYMLGKSI